MSVVLRKICLCVVVQDARNLLLIFRSCGQGYKNANAAKHIITPCHGGARGGCVLRFRCNTLSI